MYESWEEDSDPNRSMAAKITASQAVKTSMKKQLTYRIGLFKTVLAPNKTANRASHVHSDKKKKRLKSLAYEKAVKYTAPVTKYQKRVVWKISTFHL